eukprot:CAMPEP_0180338914 /NCGR_PEP_ID=MMETSP0988-20121125/46181_1 /TAXON_ID=697907 /ORGANISM="non described non described, Strain CCMP2293" /LENGTH=125 /DNA_ID=CAMNT_0022327381 /DNA_START=75 /DNA_END=449 /DNA_ORIENTATION=+
MSSLAFTQAAVGLVFGGVFGRVAWRWSHAANQGGYSELSSNEQAHLFAAGNRDSYGSTGGSDAEGVSPGEQENAFILIDATTYAGAAHCTAGQPAARDPDPAQAPGGRVRPLRVDHSHHLRGRTL